MGRPTTSLATNDPDRTNLISLTTRSGLEVAVPVTRWTYRDEVTNVDLDFSGLISLLSAEILKSLQAVLAWYIEQYAPKTVNNLMDRLKAMFQALHKPADGKRCSLAASDLINYHASLGP